MQHLMDIQTVQLVLIAVIALAMLFQSIVLISLFITMRKAASAASEQIESIRSSVEPFVSSAKTLIEDSSALFKELKPKIESTSDDLAALTHSLRVQTADVQSAANEIITRARSQARRLDSFMTKLLDTVDQAGHFMTDAVNKPMRQLSAILASAKAAVESLRGAENGPRSHPVNTPGDNDMFV